MNANIPKKSLPRVLIVGGGFGGIKLAEELDSKYFQVVLLDRHNYHQFPPLIYQVASSGLEPSSIAFPIRAALSGKKNFYFRMANVEQVNAEEKFVMTSIGRIDYDYLVLACGGKTNFFGNANFERYTLPMKTLHESMQLRNTLLSRFEEALYAQSEEERDALLNIVIVGGGPAGVEIAGALAEMKRYVLPRDYPELDHSHVHIHLIDASPRLLAAMSEKSSSTAKQGLQSMGVELHHGVHVEDYDGSTLRLNSGNVMNVKTVIWVSGITAQVISGLDGNYLGRGGRIKVDRFNRVPALDGVFAIGDQAIIEGDEAYPNGHPQMAQPAIQQAVRLAKNLKNAVQGKEQKPFEYKDLGSMATIGRNKAVAEIGKMKWGGYTAWVLWLVVHLRSILSVRNRVIVMLNWVWNYFTYDRSLRLILKRGVEGKQNK